MLDDNFQTIAVPPMDEIIIRGARQHNLKNIDVRIPRHQLTVITGVSGSGKSSLAFDVLFAEAHRRFVEALSTQSRQFLQKLDAPQVDEILGLSPAIAIQQRKLPFDPRATVGSITEILDHLRLLFAKLGTLYCPSCQKPVKAYTIPEMVKDLFEVWSEGKRLMVLAPWQPVPEKGLGSTLKQLKRDGFARIRMEGRTYELDSSKAIPRRSVYRLEVVVDRLILNTAKSRRLAESLELALRVGKGIAVVADLDGDERRYSEKCLCLSCGREMAPPSLQSLSFRHPAGMCPRCRGMGFIVPSHDLEQSNGADLADESPGMQDWAEGGERPDLGFVPESLVCRLCEGSRLNETARSVRLGEFSISDVSRLSLPVARDWLEALDLSPTEIVIASRPRMEILQRLENLLELGLSYLSLERSAHSLSGGEAQRIRLAHQLSSSLSGVLYILDEPSVGLHPHDHAQLLDILFRLRETGNTVVVVEHDRQTILRADHVVDMGPGAGNLGGEVLFAGSPEALSQRVDNLTGLYLSGRKSVTSLQTRRRQPQGLLSVLGASGHNLKGIDAHFPIGCLTCVTGVSGSGKSTLVLHTLHRALARRLHGSTAEPAPCAGIRNSEVFSRVVLVDQSSIGRSSRSTPATYTGLFTHVREIFSQIPESRARGYSAGRFSFNAKGGRCETCKGDGIQRIEMVFLPDVSVQCPACGGTRYTDETLEIKYKGYSIADVLRMSVQQCHGVFENIPPVRLRLEVLAEVGLGYILLGQPGPSLSGGEAQRVKLAAELCRRSSSCALYILDEPTTGLHLDDIQRLVHLLNRLVDQGHTVIIIEHHPEVVRAADHVIDLGPGGGDKGGHIIVAGSPEEVANTKESLTGRYLWNS